MTDMERTGDEPTQERVAQQIASAMPRGPREVLRQVRADWGLLRATKYGLAPLVVLFFLDLIQQLDSTIPSLLFPEIRADLNVSLTTLALLGQLFGLLGIPLTFLVGYLSDRKRRVTLVAVGNIASGGFSAAKAVAPNVVAFQTASFADSFGEAINDAPTQSLLYDYYPIEARAKVTSLRAVAFSLSALVAPLAVGVLGQRFGWRACLLGTAPLLVLSGFLALGRLREPVRGYWERLRAGEDEETAENEEPPMRFGEALRTIMGIKTYRRMLIIAPFARIASGGYLVLYGLFLVEEFRLSPSERGLLALPAGIVGIGALLVGGAVADVIIRHSPSRIFTIVALLGVTQALASVITVLVPSLLLVVAVGVVFAVAGQLITPGYAAISSLVLPSRVRGQAIGVGALVRVVTIPFATLPAYLGDTYGLRTALLVYAPFYLVASAITLTVSRFFEVDQRSAIAAATATNDYNRAKREGRVKLLLVRDVDVAYSGVPVLFGVDLTVDSGEMVALLGTNGAGKSTLLRAISGTQPADSGAIFIDGRNVTRLPPHEIARLGIVHMPGGQCVFPTLTVAENLDLAQLELEADDGAAERRAEVFEIFPILSERLNQRSGTLSGGEQQMVGLAQAFLWKPRLLMIDELSLGLAPAVVGQLLDVVRRIHAEGATVVLVEQSINVALTVCDRAVFMEKGEVKFDGPTAELLRQPDIMRAVYLKGSAAIASKRSRSTSSGVVLDRTRPILEIHDLVLSYGGNRALDGITFTLHEGETLGLIGPNGAGKTTVFDVVSGFLQPDAGSVVYDGVDITRLRADERARLGLVRRFQDAKLFQSLTVFESICVALDQKLLVRSTFLTALQLGAVRQGERRIKARADRLIEMLELGAYRDKFVSDLSTGIRRVADLACVLACEPRVLLLDEPSSGIAQAEAEGLGPLLRRVRHETGCSMLLIEHDMPLISAASDELLALVLGKVVTRGVPDDVLAHHVVVDAYLGTSQAAIERSGALT